MIVWGGRNKASQYFLATHTYYFDGDGDGVGDTAITTVSCSPPSGYVSVGGDCNDADATIWAPPSEVLGDRFADAVTLEWSPPSAPGGVADVYDVLRSTNPGDFVGAATCIATRTAATGATDPTTPLLGQVFFYLVRADDACPSGLGSLGTTSSGTARTGRSCP